MTIYTVCTNPGAGEYRAFLAHNPQFFAISYTSRDEAVGMLFKDPIHVAKDELIEVIVADPKE